MVLKIYQNQRFKKFVKKEGLSDEELTAAVKELISGLHDGHLGDGVYKKRIAINGKGKSGGFRTILFFKSGEKAIFVYGFKKGDRANISQEEEIFLRRLAKSLWKATPAQFRTLLESGDYTEV